MRVKGEEEIRRRDRIPMRLLLGDLPAAAGADEGFAVLRFCPSGDCGVSNRVGVIVGLVKVLGAGDTFVRMN